MTTYWRTVLSGLAKRRSVILCHHGVGDVPRQEDPLLLRVPPHRLRQQLGLLADAGFGFRTVSELLGHVDAKGVPEPGYVALSFDDGMEDNHALALPLLQELGVPATFYIATGYIGARNPWLPPTTGARMMTRDELRELAAAGMELGGHTVSHPDLSTLSFAECLTEIATGRDQLEAASGVRAATFAYPFGRYHDVAREAVREAGFASGVTCNGFGTVEDPYAVPRSLMWGTDSVPFFVAKVAGVFDSVFDHPAVRFTRAQTRGIRRRVRSAVGPSG